MFGPEFLTGLVFTIMALVIEHYYPWRKPLDRLQSYTAGVAVILAGQAIWLVWLGLWQLWLGLVAFAVAGGFAVVWMYKDDAARNAPITRGALMQELDQ